MLADFRFVVFVVLVCFGICDGRKLPSYITPCKRGKDLNKCAKERAQESIPSILKGDKSFKSPVLSPFQLEKITIRPSDSLTIELRDIVLTGLENVKIEKVNFDLDRKHIDTRESFSWINIVCNYDINGRILVLPITGSGPANLTFDDFEIDYNFDFKLIKKKDGKEYIDTNINPEVKYTLSRAHYHFDNLFNGDKTLGDQMNKFLNENQAQVNQDLGSSVSETIKAVVTSILKRYLPVVPYDEIFVP